MICFCLIQKHLFFIPEIQIESLNVKCFINAFLHTKYYFLLEVLAIDLPLFPICASVFLFLPN